MPIRSMTYERKFNLKNYESETFHACYDLESAEHPDSVAEYLKQFALKHKSPNNQEKQ